MIDPSTGLLGAKCDRLLAQAAPVPRRVAGLDVDQHVALGAQGVRTRLRLHLKRPDVAHRAARLWAWVTALVHG